MIKKNLYVYLTVTTNIVHGLKQSSKSMFSQLLLREAVKYYFADCVRKRRERGTPQNLGRVLVFECRLSKENALSAWGTFTMSPIPPRTSTYLTEFSTECEKELFE